MISFKDKITLVFRSFFLQSVFNYQSFQNIGFVFTILPFLKKIFKDNDSLKKSVKRHLEIFNTQPYMVGFVAGNVLKMEWEKKDEKEIKNIKQALACAYASIGDRIFWSRLRVIVGEFTFFIFVILHLCCYKTGTVESVMVSIFVPTIFYSFYTVYIRYIGLDYSWKCGGTKNCALDSFNWNKMIRMMSRISFFLTIILFIMTIFLYGFFYIDYGSKKEVLIYLSILPIAFYVQRYFRKDKKNIFYPISAMILISIIMGLFL